MSDVQPSLSRHEPIDNGVLVYLLSDIEFSQSPQLRTELMTLLEKEQPQRLIVDLSSVQYMDSSGVATLIEVLQHQRRNHHQLVLCSLQAKVLSILEIARLDQLLTIVKDIDTAKQQ